MKKLTLHLFILVSVVLLYSCNDDEDFSIEENYLQITINDKIYEATTEEILLYSKETCGNKAGYVENAGQINNDAFFFDFYLMHFENLDDFITAEKGSYNAKETIAFNDLCNFEADVTFEDKSQDNYNTALKTEGVNTITEIELIKEVSPISIYSIQGEFSCVFVNNSQEEIPVTGKYNVIAIVYE